MSTPTTYMSLGKAQGTDNARDYLKITLAAALDTIDAHDHSANALGLPVGRVQTTVAPSVAGAVRVNGNTWQWWASAAAAIRTGVDIESAQTMSGAKVYSTTITSTLGAITANTPAYSSTATWNNAGVTFTHHLVNITDTASNAASLFVDYQVAAASKFSVTKAGAVTAAGLITASAGLTVAAAQTLTLTSATVAGAPTWSSAQSFPTGTALAGTVALASGGVLSWNAGNYTVTHSAGLLTFSAGATFTTGNVALTAGNLTFGAASGKIIPGATSLLFRNNADSADNLAITDAGALTTRAGITMTTGSLAISAGGITLNTSTNRAISYGGSSITFATSGAINMVSAGSANIVIASGTATPAGGSAGAAQLFGTTAGFGIYYGSGAPTVSAAQGSLYLRSDGSSIATRLYINTNGSTTWTNVVTAA